MRSGDCLLAALVLVRGGSFAAWLSECHAAFRGGAVEARSSVDSLPRHVVVRRPPPRPQRLLPRPAQRWVRPRANAPAAPASIRSVVEPPAAALRPEVHRRHPRLSSALPRRRQRRHHRRLTAICPPWPRPSTRAVRVTRVPVVSRILRTAGFELDVPVPKWPRRAHASGPLSTPRGRTVFVRLATSEEFEGCRGGARSLVDRVRVVSPLCR